MKTIAPFFRPLSILFCVTLLFGSCKKNEPVEELLIGNPGNPRFNLQFTNSENVDLDLYVTDPNGVTIYYSNPYSSSGGALDIDCMCNDCSQGPNENIFWPEDDSAPKGTYRYWVEYYDSCTTSGNIASDFKVRVTMNRRVVATHEGTLTSGRSTVWTFVKN